MLIVERVLLLKSVPLFASVAEEHLVGLAESVEEVDCEAGEVILRRGEMGSTMYVVVRGRVRIHDDEHERAVMGEGGVFGELAALDPEPRSASVTALEPTTLLRIDRDILYELMSEDERFTRGILKRLCSMLREAQARPQEALLAPPTNRAR